MQRFTWRCVFTRAASDQKVPIRFTPYKIKVSRPSAATQLRKNTIVDSPNLVRAQFAVTADITRISNGVPILNISSIDGGIYNQAERGTYEVKVGRKASFRT